MRRAGYVHVPRDPMLPVPFYDNIDPTPVGADRSIVEIERVYGFAFDRFEEVHWSALDAIYRSLPGAYRETETPMWFGSSEDTPPFLWASVEPTGLQVYGILPLQSWREWDSAFRTALAAACLPFRDLSV